jgi:probable FeS assembly SUF system protein SufT
VYHPREEVSLARDTDAIQIPDGTRARLAAGMRVLITQALGGSYTVMTDRGAMYRIDEKDADALGKAVPTAADGSEAGSLEEQVWAKMKRCFDPEIPVNIVDLGLVYDCQLTPLPDGVQRVDVKMTLTAPGCGMGDVLAQDVKTKLEDLPGVAEANVEVVFDPPWNQSKMSEAARLQLGFF